MARDLRIPRRLSPKELVPTHPGDGVTPARDLRGAGPVPGVRAAPGRLWVSPILQSCLPQGPCPGRLCTSVLGAAHGGAETAGRCPPSFLGV